jgi:hypothetical protein
MQQFSGSQIVNMNGPIIGPSPNLPAGYYGMGPIIKKPDFP